LVEYQLKGRDITNSDVLNAFLKVPRHLFVPENLVDEAYGDYPLPIGFGQTISQPYMIAYMVQALEPDKSLRVLEIGTGSGYTTAILAEIFKEVYTIELIPELSQRARDLLEKLNYSNVTFKIGDGSEGLKEFAPYDRILVTASAPDLPPPLEEQIADGGIVVIPINKGFGDILYRFRKKGDEMKGEQLTFCSFVPLKGKYGFGEYRYE